MAGDDKVLALHKFDQGIVISELPALMLVAKNSHRNPPAHVFNESMLYLNIENSVLNIKKPTI